MSKFHKIKWTDDDQKELERVVRNFNAKITRLQKKDPSQILNSLPKGMKVNKNALPEKVTVKQMKELINTRQDLKRELNSLKRFSKKGAEKIELVPDTDYNLQVSKWQRKEMNRAVGIVNRRRKDRLEMIRDVSVEGHDFTLGQLGMGKQAENELKPTSSFYRTMTQTDLKKRYISLKHERQSQYFTDKDYRVKENYIKGLTDNYAESDVKDIIKAIEKMDIREFLDKFMAVDLNTFEWASGPPNQEDYQGYLNRLKGEWLGLSDDDLGFSKKHRARYGLIVNGNIVRSSNKVSVLEDMVEEGYNSTIIDLIDNVIIKGFK